MAYLPFTVWGFCFAEPVNACSCRGVHFIPLKSGSLHLPVLSLYVFILFTSLHYNVDRDLMLLKPGAVVICLGTRTIEQTVQLGGPPS